MEICNYCKNNAKSRCTRCLSSFYCSQECQKKDWKNHKTKCINPTWIISKSDEKGKIILSKDNIEIGTSILYEKPIFIALKNDYYDIIDNIIEKTNEINCNDHSFSIDGIVSILQFVKEKESTQNRILRFYLPEISNDIKDYVIECLTIMKEITNLKISIDIMFKVYFIVLANAFCDDNNNAVLLYQIGCIISHSCIPNSNCIIDESYLLTVRSITKIQKGNEITHCYDLNYMFLPTKYRKLYFKQSKFFDCKCDICKNPPIIRYYKCNCLKGNITVNDNNECGMYK